MGIKNEKNPSIPRRKKLNRTGRLQAGHKWLQTYKGKNRTRGYAKHFGVNLICAIIELRLLGVTVTEEYEKAIKGSQAAQALLKKKRKEGLQLQGEDLSYFPDIEFAYIAGYTSGGFPYGIRCEEMEAEIIEGNSFQDENLSFMKGNDDDAGTT